MYNHARMPGFDEEAIQQFRWEEGRITTELRRHRRETHAILARVVGRVGRATALCGI